MRVHAFGGRILEMDEQEFKRLDYIKEWMKHISTRIEAEIKSVRGYPLTAKAGSGPVIYIKLKGAEGDVSAARELREKAEPILREELDRQSKKCEYSLSSYNKKNDLLFSCVVGLPPMGEG